MTIDLSAVHFDAQGLVPAVAQDVASGEVLLVAFMNVDALHQTLTTGEANFWSRSRGALWHKGEASGHTLRVAQVLINCEQNSILLRVRLTGPGACHDGYRSCYYRQLGTDGTLITIAEHTFDPEEVYRKGVASPRWGEVFGGSAPYGSLPDGAASSPGPLSISAGEEELAVAMRALYAGYWRLRDEDFTSTSNTSRFLHDPNVKTTEFLARAREELDELQGVIAGTHQHTGTRDDILLEASQVIYWLCLAAIRDDLTYADWQPDVALAQPPTPSPFLRMGRGSEGDDSVSGEVSAILTQVSALLAQTDVAPIEPVQRDLASLLQRLQPAND